MINVALTGNVASGKSHVAGFWAGLGVPVVSADELAREAVAPSSPGLNAVVEHFGSDVLTADGALDRDRMRAIVFEDPEARERLESIIHPVVWRLREAWLDERRREGAAVVVSEIPLLFETGREGDFDVVVLVDAPEEVRLARMVEHRGQEEAEARRVIASQMPSEAKRAGSDHVIENTGTLEDVEARALAVLEEIRARSGAPSMRMDLHLHTAGSFDCLTDPERVVARFIELGYDRIAITDHNRLHVGQRMSERYPDRVIAGEEVKTAEGIDVIGLYLTDEIPKGTPAEETIGRIRAQGGIPYLPHPYAGGKGGGGRHAERLGALCDVIEVFNARLHSQRMNDQAEELAARLGKLRGAGSDAHSMGEIGNALVELPAHPNSAEALRAALRSAECSGREASRLVHLHSTWAKVAKKLPGARTG